MWRSSVFWLSYGKCAVAFVVGFGVATVLFNVPPDVTIRLAVGAILGFPPAYSFGRRDNSKSA